jgi:hypothetical protein
MKTKGNYNRGVSRKMNHFVVAVQQCCEFATLASKGGFADTINNSKVFDREFRKKSAWRPFADHLIFG